MSVFIDEAVVKVRSGRGGNGMVHFRREKYVSRGGPDGGDGGRGGSVILVVDPHLNTLYHFRHQHSLKADDGEPGGKANRTGRSAQDLLVPVPPGTLVFDDDSGDLIGDLTESGQQLEVCPGGRGGRGNVHFKNSRNQVPRVAEKGEPGVERTLRMELKLIADVGLVGAPNAGKSTLLAAVTNARPKIAPYPFTTLAPNLGVSVLDHETTIVLADIPGLIEGAHEGVGLGHDFLRHIQRTRVLIHLLDGLSEDPVGDFFQINAELAMFDPALGEKPQIVALNKCDLPEVEARAEKVRNELESKDFEVYAISAITGSNVRKLLYRAAQILAETPEAEHTDVPPVYRYETDPNAFTVEKISKDTFQVSGAAIERAAAMTYWEHDQSQRRFQRIIETVGIDTALREAGVQPGNTVRIGDYELEWAD